MIEIPKDIMDAAYKRVKDEMGETCADSWNTSVIERVRFYLGKDFQSAPIDDIRRMCINIRKRNSVATSAKRRKERNHLPPDYLEYITSAKWKAFRIDVIQFWGGRCAICYKERASDVHHRTYERFKNEKFTDCILLCRPCHDCVEQIIKGNSIVNNDDSLLMEI